MKTKRLITTIAAIVAAITVLSAAALAISLPSAKPNAEPTPVPTPTPAETTAEPEADVTPSVEVSSEAHDISTQEPTQERLHFADDLVWLHKIEVKAREYRLAEMARLECTHEDSIAYHDTDTGASASICTFCGITQELAEAPDDAVVTNAAVRAICAHVYSDWIFYNSSYHKKMCNACMNVVYEAHTRVSADCETHEHCSVCGERDSSWRDAYGHDMQYLFDWDEVFCTDFDFDDPLSYHHEYRCCRRDNDDVLICDYVPIRENCNFTELFWDAEENGEHEMYYVCPMCEITFFIEPEECYYATKGIACYRCSTPHAY